MSLVSHLSFFIIFLVSLLLYCHCHLPFLQLLFSCCRTLTKTTSSSTLGIFSKFELFSDVELIGIYKVASNSTCCNISLFLFSTYWELKAFSIEASSKVASLLYTNFISSRCQSLKPLTPLLNPTKITFFF